MRPAAADDPVWVVVQLGEDPTGFHDQEIVTCVRQTDGTWIEGGSTRASST